MSNERAVTAEIGEHYRHAKTGGVYVVTDIGRMQCRLWSWPDQSEIDDEEVVIYEAVSEADRSDHSWVRPRAEFEDGRFEHVTLPVAEESGAVARDAARYRWLRDGNGYAPEENFARGGVELDDLCDEGIREAKKESE